MTDAPELPKHTPCGARLVVVSRIADDLEPVLLLWCPVCDVAPAPVDTDPPRAITIADVTPGVLLEHLRLMDGKGRVH